MKWIVAVIIYCLSFSVWSHPVAYEDAFSYMSINSAERSENTLVYSPKWWLGTGVMHVQNGDHKWTNLHLGLLLKRWNNWESQGNFYLFGGPGVEQLNGQEKYFTRTGAQADWESRKIYTMIKYTSTITDWQNQESYEGRVGFAPFLAGYKDLNIWAILQVDHNPKASQQTEMTPLVRMFYKNVLWELGSSLNNKWLINFMVRF